ncbi:cysteine dioxygenase family protein [Acetobacter oeni]|uniref:Cysteine dioxygenase n=1 Tax=Acetobacter oeni TaxID=304077 RepID=A0A511XMF3_9PROT|nr:cysteine dioxygenase [Acetobacter oeni]MBB3883693.1 putative metal-dependent enzyme (double-stranded beta helix superfamily) [Acetobacter oeni]NHO19726.1 cysteine dioxygenase [Acetobacter oeni]GBR02848.1 cysteine dioxygenase type I [Acetobacter oeni LMG 21952]GEN64108.1 cysteine dioxygenase [Acetobacter oeni]
MSSIAPLRDFVVGLTKIYDRNLPEAVVQQQGAALLRALVARDTWLPDEFAQPHPERYSQYLLHCDPLERFSVVSFVWGPGQKTPLHDHRVWGLIGMLRGRESETQYEVAPDGTFRAGETTFLEPGEVATLAPGVNDYHLVANAFDDRTSVSIHVYGANIGGVSRATYDPVTGTEKAFISGYSSEDVPNLWDRSRQKEAA